MNNNSYRYNHSLNDINYRYIVQIKKDNGLINKSIKMPYLKLIELLKLSLL